MKKIILSAFVFSLLFVSCVWDSKNNSEVVPEYNGNVVWTKEFSYDFYYTIPVQNENFIYDFDSQNGIYCLYKLDLKTGDFVWYKETSVTNTTDFPPVVSDSKVYVYCGKGLVCCYDDKDGGLLATIQILSSESNEKQTMDVGSLIISSDGKYLFFEYTVDCRNCINDDGIMRVCIKDVSFEEETAEEAQTVYAEMIWRGENVDTNTQDDEVICANLIEENGLVYFITSPWCAKTFTTRLGCFAEDVTTPNTVKWIREVPGFNGVNTSSLYILDNYIYVFENSVGCFNKETGLPVWTDVQSTTDLKTEPYCGGIGFNEAGVFYDDGCFYYTTLDGWGSAKEYGCDQSLIGNIKCLDAKTGKLKWWYMPKGSGMLCTRPVVSNGKVFVNTWGNGLYVFDKKTGSVIGADTSVYSSGTDRNYVCDGNVIYFNYDTSSGTRTLTCIKP